MLRSWGRNSWSLEIEYEINEFYSLSISRDLLAIGTTSNVKLCDLKSRAFIASYPYPCALFLTFSPDCTRLAGAGGVSLRLWDVPSLMASLPYKDQYVPVLVLAFSPDCSRLASGSMDGTVMLWDTCRPCQQIATQKRHSGKIRALSFSPDGV